MRQTSAPTDRVQGHPTTSWWPKARREMSAMTTVEPLWVLRKAFARDNPWTSSLAITKTKSSHSTSTETANQANRASTSLTFQWSQSSLCCATARCHGRSKDSVDNATRLSLRNRLAIASRARGNCGGYSRATSKQGLVCLKQFPKDKAQQPALPESKDFERLKPFCFFNFLMNSVFTFYEYSR